MKFRMCLHLGIALLLCAALPRAGWAQQANSLANTGRALAAQWQDAVVTIKIVWKVQVTDSGQNHQQELPVEAIGTIINPSGLTVTSLSAISAETAGDDGDNVADTSAGEVSSAKLLLADGRELPAKIVLRDDDFDLAFICPLSKPEKPLTALDLTQSGEPSALEQVLVIDQVGHGRESYARHVAQLCDRGHQ